MFLYIKYMVSLRCIIVVKQELQKLDLHNVKVELGTIEILEDITDSQILLLGENLKVIGLEVLNDKRNIMINKIQSLIIDIVHNSDELLQVNYSTYISEELGYDYTYLANLFSEVKAITIQQFMILHKIERVKELLLYDDLNLTEISHKLNYSSVAHLSHQFKKVTGLTPSYFKEVKKKRLARLKEL